MHSIIQKVNKSLKKEDLRLFFNIKFSKYFDFYKTLNFAIYERYLIDARK